MRFSEKTFEVRFCAALSGALMPFNRNPQWFGMTQAQERISGIDTMLMIGGHLLVFQFKAQHEGQFHLEKFQWTTLSRLATKYPRSVYYVFPEMANIQAAAAIECLLKHSWCSSVSNLGVSFKSNAESTTLTLDPSKSSLVKKRPKIAVSITRACTLFGCFCPHLARYKRSGIGPDYQSFTTIETENSDQTDMSGPRLPFSRRGLGISIGDVPRGGADQDPISSSSEFEKLFGDGERANLGPGLFGLFLPNTKRR